LDVVAQHNAGLIVVGNRGHSETTSLLIGSVSHHVIQHARVPVLVVRDVDQAPGS
jgi:nucleotide-binding universal stress UspA family protein